MSPTGANKQRRTRKWKSISSFAIGDRVRVAAGPYDGRIGTVQSNGGPAGHMVRLDGMGGSRAVMVGVAAVYLERAE